MKHSHPLDIGTSLIVYRHAKAKAERTRIVNQIGNYILLENGMRIHVNDDAVGPGKWHSTAPGNSGAVCIDPLNGSAP